MTKDEKKDLKTWLYRYIDAGVDIDSMHRELAEWVARAEKITQTISDMPRGTNGLTTDDIVVKTIDLQHAINAKVDEAIEIRAELDAAFTALDPPVLGQVMRYRYINGLAWNEIAIAMNYTERHILRFHGSALKKLKDVSKCHF